MTKLYLSRQQKGLHLFTALILALTILAPIITPVYALGSHPADVRSLATFQALPAWFIAPSLAHEPLAASVSQALPAWLPPAEPVAAPRLRTLALDVTGVRIEDEFGATVVTKTLTAGEEFTFYAIGYNGGLTESRSVTWTLSTDIGPLAPSVGPTTTLSAETANWAILTAKLETTPSIAITALITVNPGLATRLELSPASETITAGQEVAYTALAFDQYDNPVDVSASTTFEIDSAAEGSWSQNTYTAEKAGSWTVSGVYTDTPAPAVNDTASLTVVAGPVNVITVTPASAIVTVGATLPFTATGADEFGNRTPLTPNWDSDVGNVISDTDGLTATATFNAQTNPAPDSGTVSASQNGVEGQASVEIVAGPLYTITISPDPATVMVGTTRWFVAAGTDQYGNSVSVSPDWATNGGSMAPGSGINSQLTALTVAAEGRLVTATKDSVVDTALVNIPHGPVAYFEITPATITTQEAGVNFGLTIRARDSYGNLATRYNEQANLADSTGTLTPVSISFTNGQWTGVVRITRAASGVVITVSAGVTTSVSNAFTVLPSALHHFSLEGYPVSTVAGTPFVNPVVVTAFDIYNNVKTNYTGNVYFTSDDPQAVLPYTSTNRYPFLPGDNGSHSFPGNGFQLRRTVTRHITVTEGTISQGSGPITVRPAGLLHFGLSGCPTPVTAGESWDNYGATVIVTAFDVYGNVKTDYDGYVHFESSDLQAVLPHTDDPYHFNLDDDRGIHSFDGGWFELRTTPNQHITVVDGSVRQQSAPIVVYPGVLDKFTIGNIDDQTAGVPFTPTIIALDYWNNRKTDYAGLPTLADTTGTISPTNTDTGCFLNYYGACAQSVVITRAWNNVHITVTDVSISAGSNAFDVSPDSLHHIRINSAPDNGGPSYAYPVEVGQHVMNIYQTYNVWAAGYDQFDNYRDDLGADWGLTGVLAAGEIAPTPALSATFNPAPVLSGTGVISAAYGVLADSTGLFTIQAPWLVVKKIGPQVKVPAGTENMQYTIVYTNVGTAPAYDVHITDTYDSNTSYAWASGNHDHSSGSYVVWTDAQVAVNERVEGTFLLVDVAGSLVPNTVLTNVVEIGGLRVETRAFTETTVVTATPDLIVLLDDLKDPVGAGNEFILEVTLRNDGTAPVSNIVFDLSLDSHLTFISADPLVPVISPTPGTGNVGRWELANLDGHGVYEFQVTVKVDDWMENGYTLFNRAQVQSDQTAPAYATEPTLVTAPILVLSQVSAPRPAVAYNPLTFTLGYSNVGQAAAAALIITDAVPGNTDYATCYPAPCSESDGIVTWLLDDGLESMDDSQVGMVVNVHRNLDSGTVLTNLARIQVFAAAGYSATAELTTTVVSTPALSLHISAEPTYADAGEEVLFTLDYSNTGSGRAYGVSIDVIQPSLQYVLPVACLGTLGCSSNGEQLAYNLGTVDGGVSDSISMLVHVRDPLPADARIITAAATINTSTPGDDFADNASQEVVTFTTLPDLQIQVDYLHNTPYPSQRLTYTLNYSNAGHIATTDVVITFAQPRYTTFDPSASSGWQDQGDGQYVYPVGELDYEGHGTLLFVITMPTVTFTPVMTNFDAAAGIYHVGGSRKDAAPVDNWQALPQGVPDVVVEKVEVNWATLLSGQFGQHVTVTVRNLGTSTACNSVPANPSETQCVSFYVDLYINPDKPPQSYPGDSNYGDYYSRDIIVSPGLTNTTVITNFALSGSRPSLYIRLDNNNYDIRTYGDVPEYNELNNVYGPIYVPYSVYLPLATNN